MRLSQPAVSKLVAGLEQDTGLALFRRERRRLVPTEEGMILHRQAQDIFARLHDIGRLSEELRNLASGRLNVVTMMALGRTFLPDAMSSFLRERPAVMASLHIRSSRTVVDQIVAQQADLGFTMLPVEHPAVSARLLCRLRGSASCHPATGCAAAAPSTPATWRASASSPSAWTARCAGESTGCSTHRASPASSWSTPISRPPPAASSPTAWGIGGRALHRLGLRPPGPGRGPPVPAGGGVRLPHAATGEQAAGPARRRVRHPCRAGVGRPCPADGAEFATCEPDADRPARGRGRTLPGPGGESAGKPDSDGKGRPMAPIRRG